MLFNSWEFLVFLTVVLAVYYALNLRAQNIFLLIASYFFYSWWDWRFSSLLLLSTFLDFFVGRALQKSKNARHRKIILTLSLVGNMGMLCTFKYFNFFISSFAAVLEQMGMQANLPTLNVILPVGISFYTFQTMSYTIDVYRKAVRACPSLLSFALYVSYFPQLVAGPIERPDNLLPQLRKKRLVTENDLAHGFVLILVGFVKKLAIADSAAPLVNAIFSGLEDPNWSANVSAARVVLGIFLFTIQIYGDFSGYTDIARGVSRLLGVRLIRNFNQPYLSQNVSEFWQRWHISLSSWIRDYLYIPLGGNRGSLLFTCRNLLITLALAGLWHGANWTFVIWGLLHGMYLVLYKLFARFKLLNKLFSPLFSLALLRMLFTFVLVSFAWLFFRAPSMEVAIRALKVIVQAESFGTSTWDYVQALYFALLVLALDIPQYVFKKHTFLLNLHAIPRGVAFGLMLILLLLFHSGEGDLPFIYFQF